MVAGCTSSGKSAPSTHSGTSAHATVRTITPPPSCLASVETLGSNGPQVHAQAGDFIVNGLVQATASPPRVGDVKVVWRATGSGQFAVGASGPGGRTAPLVFGPEPHSGSNFNAPGDEWGTGLHFAVPGCWQIHVSRGSASVNVTLGIAP
jgi:hypothetical protein